MDPFNDHVFYKEQIGKMQRFNDFNNVNFSSPVRKKTRL